MLVGGEFAEVEALLMNHPRAIDKIGSGVDAIVVDIEQHHNSKCFFVVRADGTFDDFSYRHCIDGERKPFAVFCDAARKAVRSMVSEFKRDSFGGNSCGGKVFCAVTGKELLWDNAVVDHQPPLAFSVIVNQYIDENSINLTSVKYVHDVSGGVEFDDAQLSACFTSYHQRIAVLRVIDRAENSRTAYIGRIDLSRTD